jgi:inosine-uridine nucleoside N-ribohydrolase
MAALVHLDTDLGGDPDDLCALALLLGRPDVELTGITTTSDAGALRAGMVEYVLRLAGRADIPLAAGADGSLGGYRIPPAFPDLEQHWPGGLAPRPAPPGAALDLLAESISAGATVVAVGPYTNLALLEATRPGTLAASELIVMGGCVHPVPPGLPAWGPEQDYNLYQDTLAARIVFEHGNPLVVPLEATLQVTLKRTQVPRLRAAGALGELIALQGELEAASGASALGRAHPGLPDDLLNFQHDPLTCAVAAGWDGAVVEELPLTVTLMDGLLRLSPDPGGKLTRVVTRVDSAAFDEAWLRAVEHASGVQHLA